MRVAAWGDAMMPTDLELAARLLLAAVLGGVIGIEREERRRAAGLRTMMLVTLGAALFGIISIVGFPGSDPARVAAQVVTGIGFLGAGIVIQRAEGVRGVTTAASIWAMAAIGLAAGIGLYFVSITATVIVFVILRVIRAVIDRAFPSDAHDKGEEP